jgi:hypothetical protein
MSCERLRHMPLSSISTVLLDLLCFKISTRIMLNEVAHEQYIRCSLISKLCRSERYAHSKYTSQMHRQVISDKAKHVVCNVKKSSALDVALAATNECVSAFHFSLLSRP